MDLVKLDDFFATARTREEIRRRREAGMSRDLWTTDPVFRDWRYCNVHRENDKTTVWFRENVRSKLMGLELLNATVIFRWFNKIETGEIIKDLLLMGWSTEEARRRLTGISPVVTGAYIIKGPDGLSKLDGVLACIDRALPQLKDIYEYWNNLRQENNLNLEAAWKDLRTIWYLGPFMAYEVVSDLRWNLLQDADDINTWANAGPGCARGLGWVIGDLGRFNSNSRTDQAVMLELMERILRASKEERHWPARWQPWEMREVEHWCCEYDKINRARSGQRLKRRFP
jgi:hypothetical protein